MKLPIGIQDFEKIRRDGYLYIDKTEQVYRLVTEGSYYFLSRPRRFGKSLLISTIKALFLGKRELFKGLAIDRQDDWEWAAHPVMHLDLNTEKYDSKEKLDNLLNDFLVKEEAKYGRQESETSLGLRFQGLIQRACEKTGRRVVILVDEYDKPMLQAIGNRELQDDYWGTLKGFYTEAEYKTSDGRIDLLIETPDYRYVIKFKLDGTAEEALQQIKDRQYALPYELDDKKTYLIGINFSDATRTIERWVVE